MRIGKISFFFVSIKKKEKKWGRCNETCSQSDRVVLVIESSQKLEAKGFRISSGLRSSVVDSRALEGPRVDSRAVFVSSPLLLDSVDVPIEGLWFCGSFFFFPPPPPCPALRPFLKDPPSPFFFRPMSSLRWVLGIDCWSCCGIDSAGFDRVVRDLTMMMKNKIKETHSNIKRVQ